jgi:tight adherence protein C
MTAIAISLVLFVLLMAAISYAGYTQYAKPARILEQLGSAVRASDSRIVAEVKENEFGGGVVRILKRIGEKVPVSPINASEVQRSLMMAGYRGDNAVTVFYGLKVVAAAALACVAFVLRDFMHGQQQRIMMIIAGGGLGFMAGTFVLERLVRARHERLRRSLPDLLDLMVVSVEAGLGLDQAIMHVSRELRTAHPELCEEWALLNLEMRAGKRRSDALRNLAERTGEGELRKLVAILIQNDRFGTSMADALRSHSDFMRTRRRQEAEERAGKVGVKLVFPIFFFVLPSMMIVTAGPAILQLVKQLFPLMNKI